MKTGLDLQGLWRQLRSMFKDTCLYAVVKEFAVQKFSEFGYKGIRKEYDGIQYTVELQYCEITFWHYKMDVGCSIRPISADPEIRYATIQIDEKMVGSGFVRSEVDRQMQMIVHNYRQLLLGDFTNWSVDDT
ncbi:MAG: hypothetical protein NT018_13770 [Armatimonadetes bacterium]|nr:hypothetical protein [Armatimonadota bacterium]